MQEEVQDWGSVMESRNGLLVCDTAGVGYGAYWSWRGRDSIPHLGASP